VSAAAFPEGSKDHVACLIADSDVTRQLPRKKEWERRDDLQKNRAAIITEHNEYSVVITDPERTSCASCCPRTKINSKVLS
jgi:hypothetical protein